MKTQSHTPLPWEVEHAIEPGKPPKFYIKKGVVTIASMNGPCDVYMRAHNDAHFIIKAVNCHEELLKDFKALRNWLSDMAHWGTVSENVRNGFLEHLSRADKVLAKAEGK